MKSKNNEERRSRLLALRESLNLTASEMAKLCNIEPSMYGRIEQGQRDLSMLILEKISDGLELRPFRLLEYLDRYCSISDIWYEISINSPKKQALKHIES